MTTNVTTTIIIIIITTTNATIKMMLRTKWKRQTAVGIELLAEAGNMAALQQVQLSPLVI